MVTYRYDDYVKNLIFGIYEDELLMKRIGTEFGFDMDNDVFVMMSLGFHDQYNVTDEEKKRLHDAGKHIALLCYKTVPNYDPVIPFNNQVTVLLFAKDEQQMRALLLSAEQTALEDTEKYFSVCPVRIGEGNIGSGIQGIKESYHQSVRAIRAGAIFKQHHRLLRFNNMEIYSILDEIMRVHRHSLFKTVLSQLTAAETDTLCMYYECKEDVSKTAERRGLTTQAVMDDFASVKSKLGLDVHDSEDNFKLHLVMLAVKAQRYIDERGV